MPPSTYALIIAGLSLSVSLLTLWLTLLHKGVVRMTHPTQIFFCQGDRSAAPQVYLRSLVYCTAKRGHVVENMFVRVRRAETQQNFNIWVFGSERLERGSGMFVGEEGVACRHHFFTPWDGNKFQFLPGTYTLDVFAVLVGTTKPLLLRTLKVELTQELAQGMADTRRVVFFDWGPDSGSYHAHLDAGSKSGALDEMFEVMEELSKNRPKPHKPLGEARA